MRKMTFIGLFIVAALVVSGFTNVDAVPTFNVQAYVDPSSGETDNGTITFDEITYTARVLSTGPTDPGMNFFTLEFENDVFVSLGNITTTPAWSLWEVEDLDQTSRYKFAYAGLNGDTIGAGDSLTIDITTVTMIEDALTDASYWNEGPIWAQSWRAFSVEGAFDGGSTELAYGVTSASVPEAATGMMLGICMVGLAGVRRKFFK